jgi:predicted acylesterase/phospholipase RssA
MASASPYDQLVFSGGGLRCFWQGGFLDVVQDAIGLEPERIASVSGGALAAAGFICRRAPHVLDVMCARFAQADSNVAWHSFEEDGLTPHQRMYREVVDEVIDDAALEAVADGPHWQVLLGHPPSAGWPKATGAAAVAAYEAELHTRGSPHFSVPETLGVTSSLVDARRAAREGRLTDLICAAAVIPPVFEPPLWDGRPVIDGGLADQAPLPEPSEGDTLVLLTRPYDDVPDVAGRIYVWPRDETPADKIDFTDPDKLRGTWDCGMADGRRYLKDR